MRETSRSQRQAREQLAKAMIDDFSKKRVLVIGDSILDAHTYLELSGICLEFPVPRYIHKRTEFQLGGAANVIDNLAELGAQTSFISLVGNDDYRKNLTRLIGPKVDFEPVVEIGRKTTLKERFWVEKGEEKYPLWRINRQTNSPPTVASCEDIIQCLERNLETTDVVLLVDYSHGMMSKDLIDLIKQKTKAVNKQVIASSQISQLSSNHLDYQGIDLICMNRTEAEAVLPNALIKLGELSDLLVSPICVTLGKSGSRLYQNKTTTSSRGIEVQEVDPTGAGDSFLAALALCDYQTNPSAALTVANTWAALSVTKHGTEVPKKQELLDYFNR